MNLPTVGQVFAGKYAIEAVVGRGGMGIVLAARHIELDERVAIKLILAEDGPRSADFVARFVREAKLASKIKNEHVVRIIDVARLETGEPYIVMELLEGQDLSELLSQRGPLPVDLAALYVLHACEALAEAHAIGIVHRDLKPANLFLTTRRDGQPCIKVLDFGISKLVGAEAGQAMTKTNALLGSPYYMSPDQLIQSKDVDARSDVWALGVILFELLSQRYPFEAEDAPQLIAHILHTQPPTLLSLRSDVPPELSALVQGALVKDRTQRVQNVGEFASRLAAFAPDAGRYSLQIISGVLGRPSGGFSATPAQNTGSWGTASASAAAATQNETARGATASALAPRTTASGASLTVPARSGGGRVAVSIVIGLVVVLVIAGLFVFRSKAPAPSALATSAEPVAVTAPSASAPVAAVPAVAPALGAPPSADAPSAAVPSAPPSAINPSKPAHAEPAPLKAPSNGAAHPPKPASHAAADPFGGVR